MRYDIAIAGGGPAGSACALSLRAHAPALRVVMIESSQYDRPRLGESLPPIARPLLEHLGVFELFRAAGHKQTFGTAAAWGAPKLFESDFVFYARGDGWHVDRAAFDAMLANEAARRGVTRIAGVSVRDAEHSRVGWRVMLSSGETLAARFLVDATGSGSLVTRACGAALIAIDHLVSFGRFFESDDEAGDPRTIVEAFEDGWWYTASLPNARRFAACMTDADIARRLRLSDVDVWNAAAAAMPVIGSLLAHASSPGPLVARAAESRYIDPASGDDWLAVGDSASRFDPLASQGIVKALRSGIFASYAIGDLLTRSDTRGMTRYRAFVRAEFDSFAAARAKYYGEEARWPDREFWSRRRTPVTSGGADTYVLTSRTNEQ
jgi:flavin-dependent dehydrogenase